MLHCKNYQQMTQKLHIQNSQYLRTHLVGLQCIYKELSKNKVTNTLMSECYCDFDQYMAHVQQMVHFRLQRSHHYHLGICPTMVPRLIFQGKDTAVGCP